jgi:hypothetical protein
MQKWDYKLILRYREDWTRGEKKAFYEAGDWITVIDKKAVKADMEQYACDLGNQGWELVSVVAESTTLGGATYINGFTANMLGGGKTEGMFTDFAGFHDTEKWVFKRQKELS